MSTTAHQGHIVLFCPFLHPHVWFSNASAIWDTQTLSQIFDLKYDFGVQETVTIDYKGTLIVSGVLQ